jgi:tetratricopeptide (TPR) repeat protein
MTRRTDDTIGGVRRLLLCLLAAVALFLTVPAASAAPVSLAVEWLRQQVDANPDDPHLHRALARGLSRAGDDAGAAAEWKAIAARWPAIRDDVFVELGRACHAAGDDVCACAAFEQAASRDPASGSIQLWLGLSLRRLGRSDEADLAFARAAELAPALRQEALLLRGTEHLSKGDSQTGERLLQQAIELDPTTETARRAQLLLPRRAALAGEDRFSLFGHVGTEFDSNLTLDSGLDLGRGTDDRDDVRGIFGAGGVVRPWQGERGSLALGYRFDGSAHVDRLDYDLQSHLLFGSLVWSVHDRATLRLDGLFSHQRLGNARYLQTRTVRPNLFVGFGETIGVSRLYADLERRSDFEEPTLSSLDQDGLSVGGGIEHTTPLPGWSGASVTIGGRYARFTSGADRDLFRFGPAYDNTRWDAEASLALPLHFDTSLVASASFGFEHYRHANVIDFLTDDGIGDARAERRHDVVAEYAIGLSRPLREHFFLDLGYRFTKRSSNVDLYAYDRHVVGLTLRFAMN